MRRGLIHDLKRSADHGTHLERLVEDKEDPELSKVQMLSTL